MLKLTDKLMNEKKVAESTAINYMKHLYNLNNQRPFNNLSFLKKKDKVENYLKTYSVGTKRNYYISIVSVLSFYKTKPSYRKIYNYYYDLMVDKKKEYENTKGQLTDKEKKNWIEWEQVENKKKELKEEIKKFKSKKLISDKQYNKILQFIVLSLYTDIQPRRNKDYQLCYVVNGNGEKRDKSKNYYDMKNEEFIFNEYKTKKKHGQQKVSIKNNEALKEALKLYFKYHPLKKGRLAKKSEFCLLVKRDGSPLTSINSITRILNKALNKKVGSSMLRHIYLTNKYGKLKDEQAKDAEAMGHTVAEQNKTYIKTT